jgi:cytoskeleton protein RodZ
MSGMEKNNDSAQSADQSDESVKDEKYDLKSIREARGITLHDIFRASRVSVINLEAIEKENYQLLPTPFIAKSFIKTYAKAIGVDATTIIRQYDAFLKNRDKAPVEEKTDQQPQDRRRQTKIISLSIIAVAVAGAFIYLIYSFYPMLKEWSNMQSVNTAAPTAEVAPPPAPPAPQNPPAAAENAPPAQQSQPPIQQPVQPAPAAAPPAVAAGSHQLIIEATGFSWIKIVEDRKLPVEILLRPGERVERTASQSFELDIGNAGGTNITYQGKPLGVLGKQGQVVHVKLP